MGKYVKQKNNSKLVSSISIKSLLTIIAYMVYAKLLVTHKTHDCMLKSFDFFVFINLTVCGKYDINVHIDTIPNNIFPNILYSSKKIFLLPYFSISYSILKVEIFP